MRISGITSPYKPHGSFKGTERRGPYKKLKANINRLKSEYTQVKYKHPVVDYPADQYEIQRMMIRGVDAIERLNDKIDLVNDILDKSSGVNYSEDLAAITEYLERVARIAKDKGFNRVYGYDDLKNFLFNEFIIKIMAKDKTSQKTNVPNAALFYGPTGCGKTLIAEALAQESLSEVVNIKYDISSKDFEKQIFNKIMEAAQQSKERWDNNPEERKRTIIILNEAEFFLNKYSPVIEDFREFLQSCSEKYKCSVFLTTNEPLDIDDAILSKDITPFKILVLNADRNTARQIVQKRLQTLKRPNVNIEKILDTLFENKKYCYSNSQITQIIDYARNSAEDQYSEEDYIKVAKKTLPSISMDSIANYLITENKLR